MRVIVPGRPATDDRVDAYLRLLGQGAVPPPDLTALHALHTAHVERVPRTSLDLVLGEDTPVDVTSSRRRVLGGRGGCSFHLNGAFSWLLEQLGFTVRRHVAGVQRDPSGGPGGADGSHLSLTVALGPQGTWLADVGLGGGLHSPVPLREGEVVDGPFRLRVSRSEQPPGGWRLEHDPAARTFVSMDVDPAAVPLERATARHAELFAPGSALARTFVLERRDADGVDMLAGRRLRRVGVGRQTLRILQHPDELRAVMLEVFGMDPDRLRLGDAQLQRLLDSGPVGRRCP